jgi:adenylate cyclase
MTSPWQLRVYDSHQLVFSVNLQGAAELGRQSEGEERPFFQKQQADHRRVVIARLDEDTVSRRHARVEPLSREKVRLTNLSAKLAIRLPDGNELAPASSCELAIPASLTLGKKVVRIQPPEESAPSNLQSLAEVTVPPGHFASAPRLSALNLTTGPAMDAEALVRWLQAVLDVFQSAAGASGFFGKAARAVVDLVGLDAGRVLLLDRAEWRTEATSTAGRPTGALSEWQPSRQVLSSICREKKTCWEVPPAAQAASLVGVKAVVAAPILNRAGEVIGAVYGDRRQGGGRAAGPITRLEAMLVSLLASGVAAGLARLEQEQAALRARVQFEQFFTPELSRHLEAEPRLLEGKDMEVTVLFCDIRRFSGVSERLGPALTGEWVGDVLSTLSRCVLAHEGTLVDYVGDELIAMWGAPVGQPDQAERACRAALDMLGKLPELSQRWQATLQEPIEVGIGLNTGTARVGNMGSDIKFKYGPLGNTINLGSRVQGATKYLKARLLITGATRAKLGPDLRCRRLCRVRVVNITEPIELYELMGPGPAGSDELKRGYEEALEQFEKKLFRPAARILGRLLAEFPEDGPTLVLNARVANCLLEGTAHFDPVWELPGK